VEWNQRWLDSLELTSAAASSQCSFILLFPFLLLFPFSLLSSIFLFYLVQLASEFMFAFLCIYTTAPHRERGGYIATRRGRCSLCRTIANSRCRRRACEISPRSTLLLKSNPQFPWRFSLPATKWRHCSPLLFSAPCSTAPANTLELLVLFVFLLLRDAVLLLLTVVPACACVRSLGRSRVSHFIFSRIRREICSSTFQNDKNDKWTSRNSKIFQKVAAQEKSS
jgi:hypothetical protein